MSKMVVMLACSLPFVTYNIQKLIPAYLDLSSVCVDFDMSKLIRLFFLFFFFPISY